jgi:hypothetical protein
LTADPTSCQHPGCTAEAEYRFGTAGRAELRCPRHALVYGPVLGRALKVAAVVGTVLCVINQLDVVLTGPLTPMVLAKIGLTYLVPFCVSSYSALAASRLI